MSKVKGKAKSKGRVEYKVVDKHGSVKHVGSCEATISKKEHKDERSE